MTERACRWGILGTALIARKTWKAIRNAGNSRLVAVASRTIERASDFIAQCQREVPWDPPPEPVGTYEDLLQRPDVDAVYVPLPTGIRKPWVIAAARAGKHVLCEKPCAVTTADLREMIDACRQHQVQFMDGVMFVHSGRMAALREVLDDGQSIGQVRRMTTAFSFRAPDEFIQHNIRMKSDLEPMGCLGDLGWYAIRFSLWVMKYQLPERVSGRLLAQQGRSDSPAPVPVEFTGDLFFGGDVSATFYCSFLTHHQQWAHVSGTRGYLEVKDFVLPWFGSEVTFDVTNAVFRVEGCDFNLEDHTRRIALPEYSNSFASAQETNLIRRFADIVLSRRIDPTWPEISLRTQQVMDACLVSAREHGRLIAVE